MGRTRWVVALVAVAVVLGACGSEEGSETLTENDANSTEASGADTPESEGVRFAGLGVDDQEQINNICMLATESNLVPTSSIEPVVEGEGGVPALSEAWTEIGEASKANAGDEPVDGNALFEELAAAAIPICEDIGWELSAWAELAACSLLTEAQIAEAVGAELLEPPRPYDDEAGCEYIPSNEAVTSVFVTARDRCSQGEGPVALGLTYRQLEDGTWWAYGRDEFADSWEGSLIRCTTEGSISVGSYSREDAEDAVSARVTSLMEIALASAS